MKTYLALMFAISANAAANILMKMGAKNLIGISKDHLWESAMKILLNPFIVMGVFSFVATLAAYLYVLSKMNLSIAYPIMTTMGFLIVVSFSAFYLKESITLVQILGMMLILGGVWMVAR